MAKDGKRSTGEADCESTRAKKPKFNRLNPQPSRMGDVPDSEEGLGTQRSMKHLAAAKEPAKKSHIVVSNLENNVKEEKLRLAALIEDKVLSVKGKDSELRNTLIKIILDTLQNHTEPGKERIKHLFTSNHTTPDTYHRVKSNIAYSRELISHYERVFDQIAFSKRNQTMISRQEKSSLTLQRIIDHQGEKIKLEVYHFLNRELEDSKAQVEGDISNLDIDLWERFAVGDTEGGNVDLLDGAKGATWAVVASNAQRGVRRAMRHLPEDATW